MVKRGKKIFRILAAILECPTAQLTDQLGESVRMLEPVSWEAKTCLEHFLAFCFANPLGRLQGIYDSTFDCNAACCPYVGHHLFGHDRSRTLFAAKVKDEYLSHVDSRKKETPDHIAVMLRSLIVQDSVEEARDLMSYCLIPAVRKMVKALDGKDNPYRDVLLAVLHTLETEDRYAAVGPAQYAAAR